MHSYLANEKFSGRGHGRHLCKKCSRLGKEELEYRQAVNNIDRCLNWDGSLLRKQRWEEMWDAEGDPAFDDAMPF